MFTTTSKPATTFTLTTSAAPAGGFSFGAGGDKTPTKPSLFGTSASTLSFSLPTASSTATPPLTSSAKTNAPLGFSFGGTATSSAASATPKLSLGTATSTSINFAPLVSSTAATTNFQLGVSSATTTTSALVSSTTAPTSVAKPLFSQTTTSTSLLPTSTVTTSAISTAVTANVTYAQLEDQINKWSSDLEEQSKHFLNQTKQLNAWDRLLIQNSDKIVVLNESIENVKQQQQQLDQELDFVLAQQKELEELLGPLEKEVSSVSQSTDQERNRIYQLAESMDSQMKQMSEDLKGIIEHLNESNKEQDANDPVTQISRILNAHMNSLQWIDRNTAEISSYLEQISKMQDMNRRNNAIDL